MDTPVQPISQQDSIQQLPSSTNKKSSKLIIFVASIALLLIAAALIFIIVLNGMSPNIKNESRDNSNLQTSDKEPVSEPRDLEFDDSTKDKTIDDVIDGTDTSINSTTDDSNFKDLNLQQDFQITN